MNMRGKVVENHTLVVRDGRIVDLLPASAAAARYASTVLLLSEGELTRLDWASVADRAKAWAARLATGV